MKIKHIRSLRFLLATAAVLILAAPFGPTILGHGSSFSQRASGAFLVDIPDRGEKYLLIFGADGTVLSEDTNDFGNGVPAASQSAFYGTWKRTGRRELVYTVLNFSFDAGGVHRTVVRHRATVRFDRRFRSFSQEGAFEVLLPAQDPLDPDEVPVSFGEFSGTGRRIPAAVR